jgi:hypothetical protein
MDLDTDMELWDIVDKAPVVKPDCSADDPQAYVEAIRAMPVPLQLRWIRCMQTMDALAMIIQANEGYAHDA